ncbi:PadR family transcriptional regulator [Inquilinus sp. Marseille-Q2685]|uniref:PadR family transcriptional regulator n=1 Tax=Inquilinus sp. Marseille-Q2685 TaxID=2866581 RepID=UPI001CE3C23E|nr:PadR family transcriptional regulator [Inquilinus sp. Marseille-Q2685]
MFGRHHRGHCGDDEMWAGGRGRGGRWGHGFGGGFGGRGFGGFGGGGDLMRAGRMLAQGDLRLLALALIEEQPRHGYEIIKLIEEKTGGWYSPSPGTVYPTLTYLEEAGYVTVEAEGSKKLYRITDEGRAYLDANRGIVDAVLGRLAAAGEKIAWVNKMMGGERDRERERSSRLPSLVVAALDNLREATEQKLAEDADAETRIVEILARAAAEIRRG